MVNIFDLFEHELECDMAYVESAIATAKYEMLSDPDTFMEAGGSGNIFQKLIVKVKEIVEKAINTIRQFFASKQVESSMKKAEEVAKANPGLLKKKVKVKDYEKLDKINKKAQADLKKCKTKAQVDDVMERYRKQRNIAIGAGAVVAVTLGACLVFSRKKGKQNEADLNKQLSETQTQIKALEAENAKTAKALYDTDQRLQRAMLGNVLKREKLDAAEKTITGLKIQNKDLQDINKNLRDRLSQLSDANRGLTGSNEFLRSEKKNMDARLARANAEIVVLKNAAKDSVKQNQEFAFKWMKFGASMEKTYQARKESDALYAKYDENRKKGLPRSTFPTREEKVNSLEKLVRREEIASDRFDKIKDSVGLSRAGMNFKA